MGNSVVCWKCGKELTFSNKRRVLCTDCGALSVIRGDGGVLSFFVPPKVTKSEAIIEIKRWFHSVNMPGDLARNSKLEELEMFFIPIWRIEGEVAGWIYGRTPVMKESVRFEGNRRIVTKHKVGEEPYEKLLKQKQTWEGIGIDLPALGTGTLKNKFKKILSQNFIYTTKDNVKKLGTIYETTPTIDELLSKIESKLIAKTVILNCQGQFEVKYVDISVIKSFVEVLYYPIWHLKYSYQGRLFLVSLDATDRQILYGRAPLDNSAGVFSLVMINMIIVLFSFLFFKNSSAINIVIMSVIGTLLLSFGFNIYEISLLGEIKLDEERISDTGRGNPLQKMWLSIRSVFHKS